MDGTIVRPSAATVIQLQPQIRAVAFDVDGTLLFNRDNTGTLYALAVHQVLSQRGAEPVDPGELFFRYSGKYEDGTNDIIPAYYRLVTDGGLWPKTISIADFRKDVWASLDIARQRAVAEGMNGPAAGAVDLLRALAKGGVVLGFATSSLREMADPMLEVSFGTALELIPAAHRIYGDDLGPKIKPDPLCYELLAERMKIDPQYVAVVEDRPQGAVAGLCANCAQVITLEGDVTDEDRQAFDDLQGMEPQRLCRSLSLSAICGTRS